MKLLITGSEGFIGSALKDKLEQNSIEIISYDIRDNQKDDVRNLSRLEAKLEDIDGVIHLAAVSRVKTAQDNPLECIHTNVGGTINVLEAVRKESNNYPWIIFGSSREVYGESPSLPVTENSPRNSINIYGVSKITGEDMCKIYSSHYGVKTRVLRFSNVYTGLKDQLDRVIPKFIIQALKDEDLMINGSGDEQFDFTYIEDTVQGIFACIQEVSKNDIPFEVYNISSGIPISLRNLAKVIIEKTGSHSLIKFSKARSYDVSKFYAKCTKAEEKLGFKTTTPLNEGLNLAIKELRKLKIK